MRKKNKTKKKETIHFHFDYLSDKEKKKKSNNSNKDNYTNITFTAFNNNTLDSLHVNSYIFLSDSFNLVLFFHLFNLFSSTLLLTLILSNYFSYSSFCFHSLTLHYIFLFFIHFFFICSFQRIRR